MADSFSLSNTISREDGLSFHYFVRNKTLILLPDFGKPFFNYYFPTVCEKIIDDFC